MCARLRIHPAAAFHLRLRSLISFPVHPTVCLTNVIKIQGPLLSVLLSLGAYDGFYTKDLVFIGWCSSNVSPSLSSTHSFESLSNHLIYYQEVMSTEFANLPLPSLMLTCKKDVILAFFKAVAAYLHEMAACLFFSPYVWKTYLVYSCHLQTITFNSVYFEQVMVAKCILPQNVRFQSLLVNCRLHDRCACRPVPYFRNRY